MKKLREYEIGIAKLSDKTHEFEFELDDAFFEHFGTELILGGKLKALVKLDKTEMLLTFHIDIKGHVRLICDRSLEEFDLPLEVKEIFRVKYGPENEELDEDLWQIESGTQAINMAQHLYDYIGIALPMKKLHPRFLAEMEEDSENDFLIYSSGQHDEDDTEDGDGEDDGSIDPRWDALRNLN